MTFYKFAKTVACHALLLVFRIRYEGTENIPTDRGFIICSNHRSNLDPIFLAHKVKQPLNFMAKAELFKYRASRWLFRHLNAFPIDRGKGDREPIEEAKRRVNAGGLLMIFIEGHRSKSGELQRPRSGAAMLAAATGADILPCAIAFEGKLRFLKKITVRYGEVIPNSELGLEVSGPQAVRAASKQIMGHIAGMLGQGGA